MGLCHGERDITVGVPMTVALQPINLLLVLVLGLVSSSFINYAVVILTYTVVATLTYTVLSYPTD